MLLWQEFEATYRDGLRHSRFCDSYQTWRGQRDLVMRQTHRAGEKLSVDFDGQTAAIVDLQSGELQPLQVFVAVLGASNLTIPPPLRRWPARAWPT